MFGQLPVLHHGDFELAQSHSIVRYLASRHGLCGDSEKETALINMIYDAAYDVFFDWASMQYSKDGEFVSSRRDRRSLVHDANGCQ